MEEGGGWDVMVCDVMLQIKIHLSQPPARIMLELNNGHVSNMARETAQTITMREPFIFNGFGAEEP